MNSILSSSYSRMLEEQKDLPSWQKSQQMDKSGFYKDMGGLESASLRLAGRAAGREMLMLRQKADEEARLERQKAKQEQDRLKLMARLGMK